MGTLNLHESKRMNWSRWIWDAEIYSWMKDIDGWVLQLLLTFYFLPRSRRSLLLFCFRLRVSCSSKGVHFPQRENCVNITENKWEKSCSFLPLEAHSTRREFASTTGVYFLKSCLSHGLRMGNGCLSSSDGNLNRHSNASSTSAEFLLAQVTPHWRWHFRYS